MRFNFVWITFLIATVMGAPLEERATTEVIRNKVAVVTGLIINSHISQCFHYSGVDLAQAYAAAIADQWNDYQNANHGTGWISGVEAQWASNNVAGLYCTTVNAIFTFGTNYSATIFANWVRNVLGDTKRDELAPEYRFALGDLTPDVYVSGIDLPADHNYFGSTQEKANGTLATRNYGRCSNSKCGFSFTNDQTGKCRDRTFPAANIAYC